MQVRKTDEYRNIAGPGQPLKPGRLLQLVSSQAEAIPNLQERVQLQTIVALTTDLQRTDSRLIQGRPLPKDLAVVKAVVHQEVIVHQPEVLVQVVLLQVAHQVVHTTEVLPEHEAAVLTILQVPGVALLIQGAVLQEVVLQDQGAAAVLPVHEAVAAVPQDHLQLGDNYLIMQ